MRKNILVGLLVFLFHLHLSAQTAEDADFHLIRNRKGNSKKIYKIIGCDYKAGFFSCVRRVMGHLQIYEQGSYDRYAGMAVNFGRVGAYYNPDHGFNWWEYYFEPISLGSEEGARVQYFSEAEHIKTQNVRWGLSRKQAFNIIDKYIKVKQYLLDEVDQFVQTNFGNNFIIGVHFRGTDKVESPRLSYNYVINAVVEQINALKNLNYKIFVATDEQAFLDAIQNKFPGKIIVADAIRSSDGYSLHNNTNYDPYLVGKQALLDALLLAKCKLLIRTSSNLSIWSTYYNPEMPVILLNNRIGYPE